MNEDNNQESIQKREPFIIPKKVVYLGVIVILMIAAFTVVIAKLINENSQCTSNPFVYGAGRIENAGKQAYTSCSCTIEGGGEFWFDDEEVYAKNPFLRG